MKRKKYFLSHFKKGKFKVSLRICERNSHLSHGVKGHKINLAKKATKIRLNSYSKLKFLFLIKILKKKVFKKQKDIEGKKKQQKVSKSCVSNSVLDFNYVGFLFLRDMHSYAVLPSSYAQCKDNAAAI